MTQSVYGVPPERVVGSTIKTEYEVKDGKPVLMRLPEIDFIDDKAGKPVGIDKFIGRRPVAAFGNSAGDREMLQWTARPRSSAVAEPEVGPRRLPTAACVRRRFRPRRLSRAAASRMRAWRNRQTQHPLAGRREHLRRAGMEVEVPGGR
jgi:hypothetical protein